MAIPHAAPAQAIDVRPLNERLPATRTSALFKCRDLEVIRIVLKRDESFPPHKVAGDVSIHCLEGCIEVTGPGFTTLLQAGEMLFLEGGTEHAVQARQDASALVTIALRR